MPTGINNVESSFGGKLMGMMAFLPLAFIPGYVVSWILRSSTSARAGRGGARGPRPGRVRAGLLSRVRAVPEIIIEPDGREVDGAPILLDAYWQTNGKAETPVGTGERS